MSNDLKYAARPDLTEVFTDCQSVYGHLRDGVLHFELRTIRPETPLVDTQPGVQPYTGGVVTPVVRVALTPAVAIALLDLLQQQLTMLGQPGMPIHGLTAASAPSLPN
jgi:hypothetical protein